MVVFSCASRAEQARGGTGSGTGEDRMFWRRRGRAAGRPGRGGDSGPRRPERSEGWCRLLKQISAGRGRRRQSRRHPERSAGWSRDQAREIVDFPAVPLFLDDGVSNEDEVRIGSNPGTRHSDVDGLEDGQEYFGWDPITRKAVKDKSSDYEYVATRAGDNDGVYTSDSSTGDTDNDGLPDSFECDYDLNPNSKDSDNDGWMDLEYYCTIILTNIKVIDDTGEFGGTDELFIEIGNNHLLPGFDRNFNNYLLSYDVGKNTNNGNGINLNVDVITLTKAGQSIKIGNDKIFWVPYSLYEKDIFNNDYLGTAFLNILWTGSSDEFRFSTYKTEEIYETTSSFSGELNNNKFSYELSFSITQNNFIDVPTRFNFHPYEYRADHDSDGDGLGDDTEYDICTGKYNYDVDQLIWNRKWDGKWTTRTEKTRYIATETATPFKKDIFIEVDWFKGYEMNTFSKYLLADAFLESPVNNFNTLKWEGYSFRGGLFEIKLSEKRVYDGINIHIDNGILGRGESIDISPYDKIRWVDFWSGSPRLDGDNNDFSDYEERYFANTNRYERGETPFYYCLIVNKIEFLDEIIPGASLVLHRKFILGGETIKDYSTAERAKAFLHEFGHSLGLSHPIDNNPPYNPKGITAMYQGRDTWIDFASNWDKCVSVSSKPDAIPDGNEWNYISNNLGKGLSSW